MAKIKTTCENCNKLIRKAETYLALKPERKLCKDCFYKWLDVKEIP